MVDGNGPVITRNPILANASHAGGRMAAPGKTADPLGVAVRPVRLWRMIRGSGLLPRLVWLLISLAHAPALFEYWWRLLGGQLAPEKVPGLLFLTGAMIFFVLKMIDVRVLRLRVTRQSFVSVVVIVALLHVRVVRPDGETTPAMEGVAFVAATWLSLGTPVMRRKLRLLLSRSAFHRAHAAAPSREARTLWQDVLQPHCWFLVYRFFLLRAPPCVTGHLCAR